MYGRDYRGKTLNFEASGGLIHASLVMQDKETDSYWSIMSGDSIAGNLKGTDLEELPIGTKAQWKDWVTEHPETLVLSVRGREHIPYNVYDDYFTSSQGFRGGKGADDRLATKQPIYSFQLYGTPYAIPFEAFENGGVFDVGREQVFLYRPTGVAIFYSTLAFVSKNGGFEKRGESWHHASGARFDPDEGEFADSVPLGGFKGGNDGPVERLDGFDTFWYNWSLQHPDTEVLQAGP